MALRVVAGCVLVLCLSTCASPGRDAALRFYAPLDDHARGLLVPEGFALEATAEFQPAEGMAGGGCGLTEAGRIEGELLPRLRQAVEGLDACADLSATARDVRDRTQCFLHVLTTDRNWLEVQEAIHACLAENREAPQSSRHVERVRARIDAELDNTHEFKGLIEASPSRLIPETSGEETTYMHKAPFAWQLECKLESMERHLDDVPGPWFDELLQPGGWTSDLRDRLNTL